MQVWTTMSAKGMTRLKMSQTSIILTQAVSGRSSFTWTLRTAAGKVGQTEQPRRQHTFPDGTPPLGKIWQYRQIFGAHHAFLKSWIQNVLQRSDMVIFCHFVVALTVQAVRQRLGRVLSLLFTTVLVAQPLEKPVGLLNTGDVLRAMHWDCLQT